MSSKLFAELNLYRVVPNRLNKKVVREEDPITTDEYMAALQWQAANPYHTWALESADTIAKAFRRRKQNIGQSELK